MFIALVLLAVAMVALWYLSKQRNDKEATARPAPREEPRELSLTECAFPLTVGATGTQVIYLQAFLNRFKEKAVAMDGVLGWETWNVYKQTSFFGGIANGEKITQEVYNIMIRPHEGLLKNWMYQQGITF